MDAITTTMPAGRVAGVVFQRMRQDFQECRPEQSADGVGNQQANTMRTQRKPKRSRSRNAQHAPRQRDGNNPGKSAHRYSRSIKNRP